MGRSWSERKRPISAKHSFGWINEYFWENFNIFKQREIGGFVFAGREYIYNMFGRRRECW